MMTRVHLCDYQTGNLDLYGAYEMSKTLSYKVNIHSEKNSNKYLTLKVSTARKNCSNICVTRYYLVGKRAS